MKAVENHEKRLDSARKKVKEVTDYLDRLPVPEEMKSAVRNSIEEGKSLISQEEVEDALLLFQDIFQDQLASFQCKAEAEKGDCVARSMPLEPDQAQSNTKEEEA